MIQASGEFSSPFVTTSIGTREMTAETAVSKGLEPAVLGRASVTDSLPRGEGLTLRSTQPAFRCFDERAKLKGGTGIERVPDFRKGLLHVQPGLKQDPVGFLDLSSFIRAQPGTRASWMMSLPGTTSIPSCTSPPLL